MRLNVIAIDEVAFLSWGVGRCWSQLMLQRQIPMAHLWLCIGQYLEQEFLSSFDLSEEYSSRETELRRLRLHETILH